MFVLDSRQFAMHLIAGLFFVCERQIITAYYSYDSPRFSIQTYTALLQNMSHLTSLRSGKLT